MHIAQAHAFCARLPGATRDLEWAFEDNVHSVFSVGGKTFAMFSMKAEAKVLLSEAHRVVMAKLSKKMQKAIVDGT